MFKVDALAVFISVADCQSFTDAANLHMQTPMAISKKVSALERELGEALFIRTTRKVKLSEFGDVFYEKAQTILNEHQALSEWLQHREDKVIGHLSVVAQHGDTYEETVYPWLNEFCQQYPELTISLDIQEGIIDLREHDYDIYWGVSDYLGEKFPGLVKRAFWQSVYGIFASPDYLKKYGVPKSPQDFGGHQVIGYLHNKPNNVLVYQDIENSVAGYSYVELDSRVQVVTNLTSLAEAGLGLINASADQKEITRALSKGTLVPVLEPYWAQSARAFVYYQQSKQQQKKVRAFIDFFYDKKIHWA